MITAINTSFKKSLERSVVMPDTDAPKTFLIPISFTLCSVTNAARPNKPRQAMIMASTVMLKNIFSNLCSALYNLAKVSSRNEYWKGRSGEYLFHIFSICWMLLWKSVVLNLTTSDPSLAGSATKANGLISLRSEVKWKSFTIPITFRL